MLYALTILSVAVLFIAQDYAEWAQVRSLFTARSAGDRGAAHRRRPSNTNSSTTFEQEVEEFVETLHQQQLQDFLALQMQGVIPATARFNGQGADAFDPADRDAQYEIVAPSLLDEARRLFDADSRSEDSRHAEGADVLLDRAAVFVRRASATPMGSFVEAFRRLSAQDRMRRAHEIRRQTGANMSVCLRLASQEEGTAEVQEGVVFQYEGGQFVGLTTSNSPPVWPAGSAVERVVRVAKRAQLVWDLPPDEAMRRAWQHVHS
jgi:hypothetical protein